MTILKKKHAKPEVLTFEEYIELTKKDPGSYASAAERMLKAIGEPELVDTSKDPKLSRIFGNKTVPIYKEFKDFYGMEETIHKVVSFFKHAAQGLEESKQVLYLLGPVGSAKSTLAAKLLKLMEKEAIYVLADAEGKLSPIQESPLGLFDPEDVPHIPERYLQATASPWALKRAEEYEGDLSKFKVVKLLPSKAKQLAIGRTEPGDENNQDISTLVGKLDIRQLEFSKQDDPDAYNFSGGLCKANRGVLEFVEMFKAPIKVLNPLLTATQEMQYQGTEAIGSIPFEGIVIAHSNESEWDNFKNNKKNEAFLDRVFIVKVPYNLRIDEEVNIYKKLLRNSSLSQAPCAPNTLEILAKFSVVTRLESLEDNSSVINKMHVYNGENLKDKDRHAKSHQEYKDLASLHEGFDGVSTRLAFKIISEVFNYDVREVAADPVILFNVLSKVIVQEELDKITNDVASAALKHLAIEYSKDLTKDIQSACLDSYSEYGQSLFDRYVLFADHWQQDVDYRDPETGNMFNRDSLNQELEKIEKPAGIANPKDFRHDVVNFCLRYQATHNGKNPDWTGYEKLKTVIEASILDKMDDLLPVISFNGRSSKEDDKKHQNFLERMRELGYTDFQTRRLVEWNLRTRKS